jgi:hypothetical protein
VSIEKKRGVSETIARPVNQQYILNLILLLLFGLTVTHPTCQSMGTALEALDW